MSVNYDEPGLHIRGLPEDPKIRAKEIADLRQSQRDLGPRGDRDFLKVLAEHLLEEKPINGDIKSYLGRALFAILEGKSVRYAFRMPNLGRPRDRSIHERDLRITLEITQKMRAGISLEKSAAEIGEAYNVSEHTATKAYKCHCHLLKKRSDLSQFEDMLDKLSTIPNIQAFLRLGTS